MTEDNFVTWHNNEDPQLLQASEKARHTFLDCWYQVALDFNRIVSMLSIASIKVTFSDDFSIPNPEVEHMWVNDIYFDEISISSVLLNSPLFLKSIKKGDRVSFPLEDV